MKVYHLKFKKETGGTNYKMHRYLKEVAKWISIQVVVGVVIGFSHFLHIVLYALWWNETIVRSWLEISPYRHNDVFHINLYFVGAVVLSTILLAGWHFILNKDNKWWKEFLAFAVLFVAAVIDIRFITPYGHNYLGVLLLASLYGILSQGVWALLTRLKKKLIAPCLIMALITSGCANKSTMPASKDNAISYLGVGPLIPGVDSFAVVKKSDIKKSETIESRVDKTPIDLFSVKLVGSAEQILEALDQVSYFKIDHSEKGFLNKKADGFSCRILLDGIPFGMNVYYLKDDRLIVESVNFMTSQTDRSVIKTIVNRLTKYYGMPYDADTRENYYRWHVSGRILMARPLHTSDGGWTFYFMK